jgi:predicted ABC-type ATPase
MKLVMPILIIIRGLPGSGKSYLAHSLAETIGNENVELLDPDMIDINAEDYKKLVARLTQDGVEEKFFPNRYLKAQSHSAIDLRKVIIWNQAFTLFDGFERTVANLVEHAASSGLKLPVIVVEVKPDPEVAKARVRTRALSGGHDVSLSYALFVITRALQIKVMTSCT